MQNEALVILGNQLFPVDYFPKNPNIKIFMMEDWELCTYEKHHKQKLIFFLSAMRNYRDDLILSKYDVDYYELSKHSKEQNYLERLKYFCEKNELTTLYYFEISDKPSYPLQVGYNSPGGQISIAFHFPTCSVTVF